MLSELDEYLVMVWVVCFDICNFTEVNFTACFVGELVRVTRLSVWVSRLIQASLLVNVGGSIV